MLTLKFHHDFDSGLVSFLFELEQRRESVEKDSGKWSSYQYVGGTNSGGIPTSSLAGTDVSVDEIRSAAAASSASTGYYPPSLHGALVGSPEPDPTGRFSCCF